MPASYRIVLNGQPADADFYTALSSVEVEESMDLPGAVQLDLPIAASAGGDLVFAADSRLAPLASVAVVATPPATDSGAASGPQCIFDGYVLAHKLHLETGTTNSRLSVWGQDTSWMMNLTEKVREWVDVTDAAVAGAIFGEYGIAPAADNSEDDSPSHTETGHSLMQRGSDIQFLRTLARRNGKICRVSCADQPGVRTGYFATPRLDSQPALTLTLNDPERWSVSALDLGWDATAPTAVVARQALFTDASPDGVSADGSDSGLPLLADRSLADFTGRPMTVMLAAPVDDGGELELRAKSVLREAAWFARCEAEADASRLGAILRAGMIVALAGVGAVHSGNYLVWSVRHTITGDSHRMKFVLVRNAVGPAPSGAGGLAGMLGAL